MKDKRAEKLSDLSGSARKHVRSLKELSVSQGEPSLQNGLDLARQSLKMLPSHASREIVVLMSSLTTCDPTDILTTIDTLKKDGIRCSVVSLSAEIRVCRYLTEQTNGKHHIEASGDVMTNETHSIFLNYVQSKQVLMPLFWMVHIFVIS